MHNTSSVEDFIRSHAARLGFDSCGFSKADFLEEEAPRLEKWLKDGMHGKMTYMENHFDKRLDPRKLVPGAKSVISLLLNYFPSEQQTDSSAPLVSKYAYGEDYHDVIRDKLKELVEVIKEKAGHIEGRVFVDSAPVLDRAWAKKSGLGWIGKNSNLISKQAGSFFFIAEIISDLELQPDHPVGDFCGTCNRCIEACPTGAIIKPYVVDGSKCISYFTIELKEEIPVSYSGKFENWVFGCDVCQDVCPWNRFSIPHKNERLKANQELLALNHEGWREMTEEVFKKIFSRSAVKRTGYKGLIRNLEFIRRKPS